MASLTPSQIRAARAMLGWSMMDLARTADVSVTTVKRMETVGPQPVSDGLHTIVQAAFETAGMRFLLDDGNGPGMRLRER